MRIILIIIIIIIIIIKIIIIIINTPPSSNKYSPSLAYILFLVEPILAVNQVEIFPTLHIGFVSRYKFSYHATYNKKYAH